MTNPMASKATGNRAVDRVQNAVQNAKKNAPERKFRGI